MCSTRIIRLSLAVFALSCFSLQSAYAITPTFSFSATTPEAINSEATQSNISSAICVVGYTKIISFTSIHRTNLWSELYGEIALVGTEKKIENTLQQLICSDKSLTTRQKTIAKDWDTAYSKYIGISSSTSAISKNVTKRTKAPVSSAGKWPIGASGISTLTASFAAWILSTHASDAEISKE